MWLSAKWKRGNWENKILEGRGGNDFIQGVRTWAYASGPCCLLHFEIQSEINCRGAHSTISIDLLAMRETWKSVDAWLFHREDFDFAWILRSFVESRARNKGKGTPIDFIAFWGFTRQTSSMNGWLAPLAFKRPAIKSVQIFTSRFSSPPFPRDRLAIMIFKPIEGEGGMSTRARGAS